MKTRILPAIIMVLWIFVSFAQNNVGIGTLTPSALLDVRGNGISYDVFNAGNDKDNTPDSAMILSKTGYLGLGTNFPQERLHVNGALVVGGLTSAPTVAGTISFNGTNFFGFNGATTVSLDVMQDMDWTTLPGMTGVATNYNLCPGPVAVSSPGYIPPVPISDYGYLYVNNNMPPPPGTFSHLLLIDETSGNFNSSQGYLITNWQQTGLTAQFAQGIFNADRSFKISRSGTLLPTSHGDNVTMVRYNTNGITDLPNQSRIRANVPYIDWASWQLIQPNTWTPVNYTNPVPPAPLVAGAPIWDEQAEFTVAGQPNQMILNNQPNSYFTAASDGFYQVNARCEFEPDDYMDAGLIFPVFMRPNAYVSIAIYYDWQGAWLPYAIGNNLQVTNNVLMQSPPPEFPEATHKMTNNNAPNISDVVWLQAGDRISIWVFHWAYTPMMLRVGNEVLYVSIHKVS